MATGDATRSIAEQIDHDYSQFVALTDIYFQNVPAYRAGQPVPASNVKTHKYDELGLVAKANTKAAAAAADTETN